MDICNNYSFSRCAFMFRSALCLFMLCCGVAMNAHATVSLTSSTTKSGYIARLLINEAPFPGERGYKSEADTKATMLAILWVLHSRIEYIPPGYRQSQIAAVTTDDILDIITVGGEKGQCDGFYRDSSGACMAVSRVHERIDNLLRIANTGKPGRFARLFAYAEMLANSSCKGRVAGADRFADLQWAGKVRVTGRAYSWMTDRDIYDPGGNFVRIPNQNMGSLGGNRFFTLRKIK